MIEKTKNVLSVAFRFGLSGLLLVYLFRKIDTHSMIGLLKEARYEYFYVAGAMFFLVHVLILIRWNIFIRALSLRVPLRAVINYFFIGLFFNLFLPSSTGGDFIRTLGLCNYTTQKAKVVASVVLDRLCGFMAICAVSFVAFFFGFQHIKDFSLLISVVVLAGISGALVLFLFNHAIYSLFCRIFNHFPKIKNSLLNLHYDIVLLKGHKWAMIGAFAISCFTQVVTAFTFYMVAKALNQDIEMIYFLIFVPLICVASSLPSIGGLGARDAGAAHLFAKIGVSSGVAVSITLINFLFMVAIGMIGGIIYVTQLSPRRVQHHQPRPVAKPKEA